MLFREQDIEDQLKYRDNIRAGSYDQLQWMTRPGSDFTDIESRIVSIHEFLHNELNNISGYGFLLQAYAYLSREQGEKQGFYHDLLCDLVGKCREAHEAYATWVGITVFKRSISDHIEAKVLDGNREYLVHYNNAEYLVKDFKSVFIKQQVVSASIRFCFQSRQMADYGLTNLETFDPNEIGQAEFPNYRFHYLLTYLPRDFLFSRVLSFIQELNGQPGFSLLMGALNGEENTQELLKIENEYLAHGLMGAVYAGLREHFDHFDSPSLEDREEHLSYFDKLLKRLDAICPFSRSKNPLFINQLPDDYERSTALNFENETLILSERPLSCIILHPEDLSESTRAEILQGVGSEPHLFIMGRYSLFLEQQYQFRYKEDEEWFTGLNSPFTAIRYAGQIENERLVVIIPFSSPDQLLLFLKDKREGLPILGCLSISAAYHKNWQSLWADFFTAHCNFSCLLLDVSPLYYIEQVFPDEETVSYSKLIVTAADTVYTALFFEIKEAGRIKAIMLAPVTDIYCQVLHYYMNKRYPAYINEQTLSAESGLYVPTLLSHIVREEHTYYYRSQNSNYEAPP